MTLVLTCLTRDFAVQASDRRITRIDSTGNVQVVDDERNKANVFRSFIAFAYTGLAELGPEHRTDYWILDQIARVRAGRDALASLNAAADAEFSALRVRYPHIARGSLRHAIVGAGWRAAAADAPLTAAAFTVSNALDENWRWVAEARDNFVWEVRDLHPEADFGVQEFGVALTDDERIRLNRGLHRVMLRGGAPDAIANTLVQMIREVASRTATVGRSVLVVSVPKPIGRSTALIVRSDGHLHPNALSSVYYPARSIEPVAYGPHLVDVAGFAMRDVQLFSLPLEQGAELPPWLRGPVVLARRISDGEGANLRPSVYDRHPEIGFEMVAEIDPDNHANSPAAIRLIGAPNPVSLALIDPACFILVTDANSSATAAPAEWLNDLGEWLIQENVDPAAVARFIAAANGLTRGEVVFALRQFFQSLSALPPRGPADLPNRALGFGG